jgi:glycerol-1-phosphate dehydrogenase [NAD(P)+]
VSKPLIRVPQLVRIKTGALARLGLYLARQAIKRVALFQSEGLLSAIIEAALGGLEERGVEIGLRQEVSEASVEEAVRLLGALPGGTAAVVGIGGGKALDVAKYVASLAGLPYFAAPTSLSNDGFCSPQSSLLLQGRRKSLPAALPYAVVVDLDDCLGAPIALWHSGVGDLCSKFTAVADWKLAFHARGTPVNDLAALMSDATVYQFAANPERSQEGIQLLATALMLNGVAMEIAGSSRPASGSEHLISHALDMTGARPRLHGLQTGTAAYFVSRLQGGPHHERIGGLLARTGFWNSIREQPFSKAEWKTAVELAPTVKDDFFTVLSERPAWPRIEEMIDRDPVLAGCFE